MSSANIAGNGERTGGRARDRRGGRVERDSHSCDARAIYGAGDRGCIS